jgi:hypothetical protein
MGVVSIGVASIGVASIGVASIGVVSCAIATGASISMTKRAAVARNIVLFIQSSFFYSVLQ